MLHSYGETVPHQNRTVGIQWLGYLFLQSCNTHTCPTFASCSESGLISQCRPGLPGDSPEQRSPNMFLLNLRINLPHPLRKAKTCPNPRTQEHLPSPDPGPASLAPATFCYISLYSSAFPLGEEGRDGSALENCSAWHQKHSLLAEWTHKASPVIT